MLTAQCLLPKVLSGWGLGDAPAKAGLLGSRDQFLQREVGGAGDGQISTRAPGSPPGGPGVQRVPGCDRGPCSSGCSHWGSSEGSPRPRRPPDTCASSSGGEGPGPPAGELGTLRWPRNLTPAAPATSSRAGLRAKQTRGLLVRNRSRISGQGQERILNEAVAQATHLTLGPALGPNHTSLWGRFDPAPLPGPGLCPAPAWGPQGPCPPSLPTGGSRLRHFGLTVKGECPAGPPWVAFSAGAPSWGGRVLSGIRATRGAAGRQATCKTGSARLRCSALKRSKPGSGVLGGRLTSSWRASLPPEEGLGKAGGEGSPAHSGLSAPVSSGPARLSARPAVLAPAGQRPERGPHRAELGTGDRVGLPPGLRFFLAAHPSVLGTRGTVGVPQTWGRCGVATWGPLQPRCGPPWPQDPRDCGVGPGHRATALRCGAENTSRFTGIPCVPGAERGRRSRQSVSAPSGDSRQGVCVCVYTCARKCACVHVSPVRPRSAEPEGDASP